MIFSVNDESVYGKVSASTSTENHDRLFEPRECGDISQVTFELEIIGISEFSEERFDVGVIATVHMEVTTLA